VGSGTGERTHERQPAGHIAASEQRGATRPLLDHRDHQFARPDPPFHDQLAGRRRVPVRVAYGIGRGGGDGDHHLLLAERRERLCRHQRRDDLPDQRQ
jgi:hypothetical protein